MNKFEDFIIAEPYTLNDDDKAAIKQASPDIPDGDHWTNPCLTDFKKRVRKYLLRQQHDCCAYCRIELHDNEVTPEIEHIVPKDLKPQWMYEPFNFCVSCKLCNIKKGYKKQVLEDNSVTVLPITSDGYKHIHPYLDKYSDNIELVGDILYKGVEDKGKYTIWLCELDRYEVAAARATELLKKDLDNYTRFLILLEDSENKALLRNVDAFIERITEKMERYKELNEV